MAQDPEELRERISNMQTRLEESTYYELFEVDPELEESALTTEVTKKFRLLAKDWHIDRFDTDGLDDCRELLQDIFSSINTAHQVLTDSEKRAEYDMELSGENTDIGSILNAESSFRRGQNMLSTGAYKGAHEQFRIACENNPDDLEYRAHYRYTEFLMLPKDKEGNPRDKARAKELYDILNEILEEMPERDWLLSFLGVIAMGLNRNRDAMGLFTEALQYNRNNVTAKRHQRLLKMRKGRDKKGFFGQLLEKFRS